MAIHSKVWYGRGEMSGIQQMSECKVRHLATPKDAYKGGLVSYGYWCLIGGGGEEKTCRKR